MSVKQYRCMIVDQVISMDVDKGLFVFTPSWSTRFGGPTGVHDVDAHARNTLLMGTNHPLAIRNLKVCWSQYSINDDLLGHRHLEAIVLKYKPAVAKKSPQITLLITGHGTDEVGDAMIHKDFLQRFVSDYALQYNGGLFSTINIRGLELRYNVGVEEERR